jgi:hypothetical protein
MRTTRGWTGLRPTVFALGLVAATAGGARADAIDSTSSASAADQATTPASPVLSYNTVGSTIGTTGVSGTPLVTFVPVTGSFMSPSSLSFGAFQVAAPTSGTTTYTNTPFSIEMTATGVNGQSLITPSAGSSADTAGTSTTGLSPNESPIMLTGVLNGSVSASNQSSVVATFDPLAKSAFQTGLYTNTLSQPDSPLHLVPSTTNGGLTSVQAPLVTQTTVSNPVPEPSSVAVFAAAIAGLAAHRWRARRRAA